MKLLRKKVFGFIVTLLVTACLNASDYTPERVRATLSLKVPGNNAVEYPLSMKKSVGNTFDYELFAEEKLPVNIYQRVEEVNGKHRITVVLTALDRVYFNYGQQVKTSFSHQDCLFYLPGFWYRRNLRSPQQAPSFHTSDSWVVREDRLSTPLSGIFNEKSGNAMTVVRIDSFGKEALTTHKEGEVIVSGVTSLGFTGFRNMNGEAALDFGFPYQEAPKSYIRKLTLAPSVKAFQLLDRGESISLTWEIREDQAADFSDFVKRAWEYSYDIYRPQSVHTPYSPEQMKEVMSNYFIKSFVGDKPLKYTSGVELKIGECRPIGIAEVGFTARVLLNAFNALEYGESHNRSDLTGLSLQIFDSYLKNGFTEAGFLKERVDFEKEYEEPIHSIRRQSEGIYALFHYLQYEKEQGRTHPEWEKRLRGMLDMFLTLQNEDGSFPRKFKDDFSIVDKSGGSTPSATLPLVMGYKYFKEKRYLKAAERTADYLENEIISKSDYFSSTLDANCEDKEASLYAATATYYLSLATKGKQRAHYARLCRKAAYFALSWYYVWDVPFATGQMLGDVGLKTRGWGNVSVENNHIDVFVFEFASVLNWLSGQFGEPRFSSFAEVMSTSMRQLLPEKGHLCGIAQPGFYPEVVQHTNWDYGKNGKGFYNEHFAPGWAVASLWELLSPRRAEKFIQGK